MPWSCRFDYRQAPLRRGQRFGIVVEGPALRRVGQLPHERCGAVGQHFRRQQEAFSPQAVGQGADVLRSQGHPEHLAGCLRQLVCLIHNEGAGVRQACPYPLAVIQQFRRAWDDPLMVP